MEAAQPAEPLEQEKPPLDLGRTLVWGALVGAWLGPVGFVKEGVGRWPDLPHWGIGLLLDVLIGAAIWALTRHFPRKARWFVRIAFIAAFLVPGFVRGMRDSVRSSEAVHRILQPVALGSTEAEIVMRLGAPSIVQEPPGPDALARVSARDCDVALIRRVLEFTAGEYGSTTRTIYLDAGGRNFCEGLYIETIDF